MRGEHIVVVEEQGDIRLRLRQRQRGVGGPRHPLGLGIGGQPDARIGRRLPQHLAHGGRARAVVGDAQGPGRIGLGLDGSDGLPQMFGSGIVHGHQDRDARKPRLRAGPRPDGGEFLLSRLVDRDPGAIGGDRRPPGAAFSRRPSLAQGRRQAIAAPEADIEQPASPGGLRSDAGRQGSALVRAIQTHAGRLLR